jgi:hypothetical protein
MIGSGTIAHVGTGAARSQDLASRYLELADDACRLANRIANAKVRATMMEVAATWERLAHLEAGD